MNSIKEKKQISMTDIKMDEIRNNLTYYVKDLIEDKFKETVDFYELKSVLKHYKPQFVL